MDKASTFWNRRFSRPRGNDLKMRERIREKLVMWRGKEWPISEALVFAGVNFSLKEFLSLLSQGTSSDIDSIWGKNNVLLGLVANSGIKTAIWIVRHRETLGINLDVQDRMCRRDTGRSQVHQQWIEAMGMDDQIDKFQWGKGKYLKNTALILAVKKGWNHRSWDAKSTDPTMGALIVALLKYGANPNIQDGCGNTALHIAMLHRDYRVVKVLLEHGAKLDIKNNGGLKPEDLLAVKYEDIDPFLYYQTGGDTNSYIHTLQGKRNWTTFSLWMLREVIEEHKTRPQKIKVSEPKRIR